MSIEKNLKASFKSVKLDMINIKNQILSLADSQNELKHIVNKIQADLEKKAGKKTSKESSKKKK